MSNTNDEMEVSYRDLLHKLSQIICQIDNEQQLSICLKWILRLMETIDNDKEEDRNTLLQLLQEQLENNKLDFPFTQDDALNKPLATLVLLVKHHFGIEEEQEEEEEFNDQLQSQTNDGWANKLNTMRDIVSEIQLCNADMEKTLLMKRNIPDPIAEEDEYDLVSDGGIEIENTNDKDATEEENPVEGNKKKDYLTFTKSETICLEKITKNLNFYRIKLYEATKKLQQQNLIISKFETNVYNNQVIITNYDKFLRVRVPTIFDEYLKYLTETNGFEVDQKDFNMLPFQVLPQIPAVDAEKNVNFSDYENILVENLNYTINTYQKMTNSQTETVLDDLRNKNKELQRINEQSIIENSKKFKDYKMQIMSMESFLSIKPTCDLIDTETQTMVIEANTSTSTSFMDYEQKYRKLQIYVEKLRKKYKKKIEKMCKDTQMKNKILEIKYASQKNDLKIQESNKHQNDLTELTKALENRFIDMISAGDSQTVPTQTHPTMRTSFSVGDFEPHIENS